MSTILAAVSDDAISAAIEAAEEIRDPLEGLVEKTAIDPGAPFAPDALERLAALKKDDPAGFERLRAQLKDAACRVTALDEAIAEENGDTGGGGPQKGANFVGVGRTGAAFPSPEGARLARPRLNRPPAR